MVAAFVFSGAAYADLNDGLTAYYPFDGNVADKSGNGNHGTEYGGAEYVSGVTGQAIRFDGTDDYIRVKSDKSLNPADQFSITFWIRTDSYPKTWSSVVCKGSYINGLADPEYSLSLSGQGVISLASAGHSYDIEPMPAGEWIFYAGVIDRKNHYARIYVNNILYREDADSYSSFNNNNEDLKIGWSQLAGGSEMPFRGSLDELRLYNRTLSESEIRELSAGNKSDETHSADYAPQDWQISLSELLRVIQFYSSSGYHADPDSEDGFAPGKPE